MNEINKVALIHLEISVKLYELQTQYKHGQYAGADQKSLEDRIGLLVSIQERILKIIDKDE